MGNGGISIGGPGGLTPGESKIEKGLSNLGQPSESDALQFQTEMQGQSQQTESTQATSAAQTSKVEEPSGPFDFQANRITNENLVNAKPGLGQTLIDYTKKISLISSKQSDAIAKKMESISTKGLNQGDAIELQLMTFELTNMTEVISKGVGKIVTAIQTMVKQQ